MKCLGMSVIIIVVLIIIILFGLISYLCPREMIELPCLFLLRQVFGKNPLGNYLTPSWPFLAPLLQGKDTPAWAPSSFCSLSQRVSSHPGKNSSRSILFLIPLFTYSAPRPHSLWTVQSSLTDAFIHSKHTELPTFAGPVTGPEATARRMPMLASLLHNCKSKDTSQKAGVTSFHWKIM